MEAISIVKLILLSCAFFDHSLAERNEPVCYSTFDFHEKVLEKQVRTEHKMLIWEERMNNMIETFKSDMNHMTETLAKMEHTQDEMTRAAVEKGIRMSQELNSTLETVMKDVKDISATPPSAFVAHGVSTSNQGNGEPIIFTDVLLNLGEGYDPTTGIFTAHTPGVYQFSVQIHVTMNTHIYVQVRKNRATVVGAFLKHTSDRTDSVTAVAVVQLDVGDTVSIVRQSGTSNPIYVSQPNRMWNSFSGTLVTAIQ